MKRMNLVNAAVILVVGLYWIVTGVGVLMGRIPSTATSEGITGIFAALLCIGTAGLIFLYEKGEK